MSMCVVNPALARQRGRSRRNVRSSERTLLGAQVEVRGVGGGELRQQVRGAGEAGRRRDAHGFLYAEGVVLDARLVVREGDAAQREQDACGEAVERRGQHVVRESLGAGREVENRRQLHRQRHGAVERQCGLRAGQAQRVGVLVGECEVGDGGDAVQTVDLEAHGALRDGGFGPDFARADPEVVHRGTDAQRVARQVGGAHGIAVRGAFVTQAARYFIRYFECAVHGRLGYAALGQPEAERGARRGHGVVGHGERAAPHGGMAVVVVRQTVGVCVGQRERERERAARDGAAERSGGERQLHEGVAGVEKYAFDCLHLVGDAPHAECELLAARGREGGQGGVRRKGAAGEIDRQPLVVLDDAGVVFREGERRQVDARAVRRTLDEEGFGQRGVGHFDGLGRDVRHHVLDRVDDDGVDGLVDAVGSLVGEVALRVGYQPLGMLRVEKRADRLLLHFAQREDDAVLPQRDFLVDFVEVVGAVDASAAQCAEYARQENRVVLLHVDWVQIVFYSGAKIV